MVTFSPQPLKKWFFFSSKWPPPRKRKNVKKICNGFWKMMMSTFKKSKILNLRELFHNEKYRVKDQLYKFLKANAKYDDIIKWKHFPRYSPFVRGIHRSPVNSTHKDQWRGDLMFSLICTWTHGHANNRDAGDLRHHRTHTGVTVVELTPIFFPSYMGKLPFNHSGIVVLLPSSHLQVTATHLKIGFQ